jgi:hypothetical protein
MQVLYARVAVGGLLVIAIIAGATSVRAGSFASHVDLDRDEVTRAAALLQAAVKAEQPAELENAVDQVIALLGADHFACAMLADMGDSEDPPEAVSRVHESLTFRPWMEAELPAGFPSFTPLHHIEVKTYPDYRMAQAAMRKTGGGESNAFWALFGHIQRSDIAMTAPVQMDFDSSSADARESSMGFLYSSIDLGLPGADSKDERVEVLSVPSRAAVSIGCRGRRTQQSINQAQKSLLDWLEEHSGEYVADGPLRVMGYNSPFTPAAKQYYEVQIPVRPVASPVQVGSQ